MSEKTEYSSPIAQTVEAASDLLKTPVSGNVMPLLICFIITVAAFCAMWYSQMENEKNFSNQLIKSLSEIDKDLQRLNATIDGNKFN